MSKTATKLALVSRRFILPVALVLILQTGALRLLSLPEQNLAIPLLHTLPLEIGPWKASGESTLEQDVTDYLKPDEYILRDYSDARAGRPINLFLAYFKSLQNSYGPHSPRVCMPGAGWLVRQSKIVLMPVPGHPEGIPVNEYVLEKSNSRILMMYWYQNDRSIWAEEFKAKLTMLPDLIRYRRTDVTLIRLVAPMTGERSEDQFATCEDLAKRMFPLLVQRFESTK